MSRHNRQTCNKGIAALLRGGDYVLSIVLICSGSSVAFSVSAQSNNNRAAASSKSTQAAAARKKPSVNNTVNPCAVAPPNASLSLGAGILGVQATSDGGKYHDGGGCGLFVVDIAVPSDSSGPSGFLPSFTVESGPTELIFQGKKLSAVTNYAGGFQLPDQLCSFYSQETLVFVKSVGANEFNLIDAVIANGTVEQEQGNALTGPKSKCILAPSKGKGTLSIGLPFSFKPSKSGGKVFRVAVGVNLASSQWQQVRVQASHDSDIK
jgi:hypothetical protein